MNEQEIKRQIVAEIQENTINMLIASLARATLEKNALAAELSEIKKQAEKQGTA